MNSFKITSLYGLYLKRLISPSTTSVELCRNSPFLLVSIHVICLCLVLCEFSRITCAALDQFSKSSDIVLLLLGV